jgi:hypothetical protein
MAGIGILARDTVDLAKRALRLNILALTCLCAAWPLAASPEPAKPAERLAVSQTAPLDERDPLVLWFKEQDRLLDDILARLARIELLVREIHRLISQIPDRLQPPAAPPPAAQPSPPPVAPPVAPPAAAAPAPAPVATPPAPPAPPPAVAPPPAEKAPTAAPAAEAKKPRRAPPPEEEESASAGIGGFLAEHGALVGGAAVTLLLLFWMSRRHAAPTAGRQGPSVASKPAAAKPTAAVAPAPMAPPEPEQEETTISLPPSSLDVGSEQADQALELADIMLSMGLGHGAAQTLTEQIRSEPKQALRHWLKLLEIYRSNGEQAEFERSAEELRLHFNVKPEDWKVHPGAQQGIENYPHIASRIAALWPTAECLAYLENLLADNRGGARSGFPQSVAEEFLLLEGMLRCELVP